MIWSDASGAREGPDREGADEEMRAFDKELAGRTTRRSPCIRRPAEGVSALNEATDWLLETSPYNAPAAGAGAVPYLKLGGTVAGWQMARARTSRRLVRTAAPRTSTSIAARSAPRASTPSTS